MTIKDYVEKINGIESYQRKLEIKKSIEERLKFGAAMLLQRAQLEVSKGGDSTELLKQADEAMSALSEIQESIVEQEINSAIHDESRRSRRKSIA